MICFIAVHKKQFKVCIVYDLNHNKLLSTRPLINCIRFFSENQFYAMKLSGFHGIKQQILFEPLKTKEHPVSTFFVTLCRKQGEKKVKRKNLRSFTFACLCWKGEKIAWNKL